MPKIDTSALISGFCEDRAVNPATQRAEDATIAWLWRIGFLTTPRQEAHLRSFEFGLYHGIATPDVEHERLVLGLMWFCWGSLADDQYDNYDWGERGQRLGGVIRAMQAIIDGWCSPRVELSNPVIAGFADFWPQLTAGLSERGRRRITKHFMDYMHGVAFQNTYHAAERVPDMATFLTMRRHTIAMIFQADVLAVVSSLQIPEVLWDSYLFRELVSCFADITAWHNDVYGLEKDIADGQTCNVVRVVAASESCSLDQAVDRVLHRARQRQRLLVELQTQLPELARLLELPPAAADQAGQLAWALRRYAYANLVWIDKTHRYDLDRPRIRGTFNDVITSSAYAEH
ncbi:terpene synthase family protein [Mycobacterium sp. SP-6446]|uniref:terpene synthase family protein n=1 Tax=Mycobacterium sp. SP-6446 TaxID=1834162 RepID=UPI00158B0376|nr:terpene synthase family protein [Mycobacterium sp. SP-6446]